MFRKSLLVVLIASICSLPLGCSSEPSEAERAEIQKKIDEGIAKARKAKQEMEAKEKQQ